MSNDDSDPEILARTQARVEAKAKADRLDPVATKAAAKLYACFGPDKPYDRNALIDMLFGDIALRYGIDEPYEAMVNGLEALSEENRPAVADGLRRQLAEFIASEPEKDEQIPNREKLLFDLFKLVTVIEWPWDSKYPSADGGESSKQLRLAIADAVERAIHKGAFDGMTYFSPVASFLLADAANSVQIEREFEAVWNELAAKSPEELSSRFGLAPHNIENCRASMEFRIKEKADAPAP
jgi:hypothetical protein